MADLDLKCGTCGGDLKSEGQWLRCRAHFTEEIADLRAKLDDLGRENEELYARVVELEAKLCDGDE